MIDEVILASILSICISILSFASFIRLNISVAYSFSWLSNVSFTIMLICVSSSSSSKNATALTAFITGFWIPGSADVW